MVSFIIDRGTMVWVILGVVGLIVWGLLGSAGFSMVVRIFEWPRSVGRPRAYGLASLAGVVLATSAAVLFVAYLVVMGILSMFLFPN